MLFKVNFSPCSIGDASRLVAGFAAVGDVAVVETVTESTGTVPA